ncbi:prophage tail fiber N-terminal domain-containing protein [Aeromonas sp. AE23HZ002T15]
MIQIHGVITDPAGKPVPRAFIELRALSTTGEVLMGSAMTFKCDQAGEYRFQLATGTYDVYAQNDQCGDMDYMGSGVVTAQSSDGPLNSILVDSGINLTPPLLDRAVEAMQRSEAAAEVTAEDRLQTGNDVVTTEQAKQVATEQAAAASTSAATASSQAGDAATSAGAAAGSASSAQKWAENPVDVAVVPGKHSALHHATKASSSASESAASATAAAASASTASAKATNANTSATTATTMAGEAATSASTAATHASAANSSKVAAATSATNAGTYASNAEQAAQVAEGAKVMTLDNAARVGTLAEQVTADWAQVQESATQVAANAAIVAGQAKEVSTNADTVSQAKTAVQGMQDVVVAKTALAQAAADTASTKASQAAQDQASANASSQRASVSEGMAEAWAQNPEGSDINGRPGEFSALHWALQAQKWAQAITSQLVWAGPWNAAAGAPIAPVANQGVPFYRISHPGVIASVSYVTGDYLHWDPATRTWFKIDGSDAVISVNGMTGAVVLSAADVGARPASWVPGWADITNKPVTMPPSEHIHPWSQLSNVPVYASRWPTLAEVGAAEASHTHTWSQLTGIPTYATRWPSWGELTDKPDLAAASHRHPWNQIDQIPVTATRWPTWGEVTDKPALAAADHSHPGSLLNPFPLTKEDLNTIVSPGVYRQDSDANVAAALNYPEPKSGSLTVTVGAGVQHRYHVYNTSRVYTRAQFHTGAFTQWALEYNTLNKPSAADVGENSANILYKSNTGTDSLSINLPDGLYAITFHVGDGGNFTATVMLEVDRTLGRTYSKSSVYYSAVTSGNNPTWFGYSPSTNILVYGGSGNWKTILKVRRVA